MTPKHVQALQDIGFSWDSQESLWNEKYVELIIFYNEHGHCNVPTWYEPNPSLAIWVKYQWKHYRYWQQGAPSALMPHHICDLECINFAWLLHSYHCKSDSKQEQRRGQISSSTMHNKFIIFIVINITITVISSIVLVVNDQQIRRAMPQDWTPMGLIGTTTLTGIT